MGDIAPDPFVLMEIVLNTKVPLVYRNFKHNWKCFKKSLREWCTEFDAHSKMRVKFESPKFSDSPQWERFREPSPMWAVEFFMLQKDNPNLSPWLAYNYKRCKEIPAQCRSDVNFSCFGFPYGSEDCSFWLGSKNSNTPCHYDTYGCNIVVQIYGKKTWLLFPPDVPFSSTRIPYEESSVYCYEDFYAPSAKEVEELKKFHNAYICTLEPNDVLIVPHKWWHFVETVETSLSVNHWIPLEQDLDSQLDESIVKFLIESFVKGSEDEDVKRYVLNPNQLSEVIYNESLYHTMLYLVQEYQAKELYPGPRPEKESQRSAYPYQYLSNHSLTRLLAQVPELTEVEQMTEQSFHEFLLNNSKRAVQTECPGPVLPITENLINSLCTPSVVRTIRKEFLKKCMKERPV